MHPINYLQTIRKLPADPILEIATTENIARLRFCSCSESTSLGHDIALLQ